MRVTVGSSQSGNAKAQQVDTSPDAVARISGLRTSSRRKPRRPWRAIGQTAATLNSGTQTPISTAIICRPCAPASRSASASADEGVEAKRHLRAGRVVAPVDVRCPDPGQVGQRCRPAQCP
jgi:hypothetical protein